MRRGFGFHDRHSPFRFNPATLFVGGTVQGAWYDPSDLTTLFQDSAGTTPVTAAGQPVGLALDKSKGLVLGSELIVNGNFSNGTTGWSATNSTLSAANNQLTVTSTANFGVGASTGFTTVIGRTYQATAQLISCSSATARIRKTDSATNFNSSAVHLVNGSATPGQTFTVYFQATATTTYIMAVTDLNPSNIAIAAVSVRELPGNHAYQSTSASRPTLQQTGNLCYLVFDGSNDSLLTSSMDFTSTNKMTVCAGLLKSSDAAQAVVAELSATIAANNGAFLLSAPDSAAANYNFSSKGTTQVNNTVTTYTAPHTAVITGQADIAAPSNIIRVNGAQAGSVATTQGTGNFGNYPLYIGRRNNATLPFNGRLYGLIVLGAAASTWQVNVTEQWMAGKTGITI